MRVHKEDFDAYFPENAKTCQSLLDTGQTND